MSLVTSRCVKGLSFLSLLTVFALSGCAQDQPQNLDSLESSEAKSEHLDQLQSWIFPSQEAETARKAFVQRCVAKSGGNYQEADQSFILTSAITSQLTREQLRKSGYTAVQSQSKILAQSDAKGRAAYFGDSTNGTVSISFMDLSTGDIPADGCMAQSYQYIYGSVEDGLKAARLAPSFAQTVADEVRADSTYTDLVGNWSSCMADAGYEGLETVESASDRALLLPADMTQDLANADADCRESVQYEEAVAEVEKSYYETVYKRVKQFGKDLEGIHETASQRVEEDKTNPKDSSPIDLSTETPTASGNASASESASAEASSSASK